ncbi:MAG TPA: DUF4267 domain-containing protein [Solirubrobacterales bacterium]|jgi:hypothetical protein|nr:DUF4267 domain-containing protein [Solirubrobacterales bacterium]
MRRRRKIDPLGRDTVLAIAAGRIGIGVGALLATKPALRALGFPPPDTAASSLARIAGSRDIALGLLAFAAREDREAIRTAAVVAAAVDAADALAFALAGRDPRLRRAGISGVLSGSAAAVAGTWAWHRLGT